MKKLIILLFLWCQLTAQTYIWVDSTHSSAPTGNSQITFGLTNRNYLATLLIPASSYKIYRISLRVIQRSGYSPTMDFVCQIRDNLNANPTTQIGSNTDTINAITFPTVAGDWRNWTLDPDEGISVTAGDSLYVVGRALTTAAADYCYWLYTTGSTGHTRYDADAAGTWTNAIGYTAQGRLYSILAPVLTSITPSSGTNGGSVNITDLAGTYFYTGASVSLTKSGQSAINATSETVVGTTSYTCTVDITGAAIGTWNVILTAADGQADTLANAFTVSSALVTESTGDNNLYQRFTRWLRWKSY